MLSITLGSDDVQEIDARWNETPSTMTKIPSDDILESLYKRTTRESDALKTVYVELHQQTSMLDSQKLKTMVKRSTDQKLRLRNFDARNERIETGAVVKSRKGLSGIE